MIRELKTLLAVAREGTFAAAGTSIGLTQAAVSAQMRRLEEDLGITLFDRSGRTARLNEAGLRTVQQSQELLRLYAGLGSGAVPSPVTQRVVIGAIASVQRAWLPEALSGFHREYPDSHVRVVPGLSMALINLVDAGEIEMAAVIRPPFLLRSDLHWITLAREPFRLLAPASETDDDWLRLLQTRPFIRYDRASFGGRQVDRFLRDQHVSVRACCELDELEAIVRLVANGTGIALVPQAASLLPWPRGVRAIALGQHAFEREIGLVHRANRSLSTHANRLMQYIAAR